MTCTRQVNNGIQYQRKKPVYLLFIIINNYIIMLNTQRQFFHIKFIGRWNSQHLDTILPTYYIVGVFFVIFD